METIRTIFEYALYIGITLPLIIFLLATIIAGYYQLRAWARGEEDPQVPQKKSPKPVEGIPQK